MPTEKDGTVDVALSEFDVSALCDEEGNFPSKKVVVFEELSTMNGDTSVVVASEKSMDEKAQTVTVRDTPKPPKTSDSFPFIPVAIGAALLVGASVFFTVRRRRYNQHVVKVMNRENK